MSQRSRANPWWGPRPPHFWSLCKVCSPPPPTLTCLIPEFPVFFVPAIGKVLSKQEYSEYINGSDR